MERQSTYVAVATATIDERDVVTGWSEGVRRLLGHERPRWSSAGPPARCSPATRRPGGPRPGGTGGTAPSRRATWTAHGWKRARSSTAGPRTPAAPNGWW
ncbi:hypothetical protein QQY24_10110 [Streptomyces sp. TG1A-8]|uniref:hypothetical protein n=1 Tax=Streptomyces sp. TG1A-8 TaxID=3051385 RepID=UPI00265C4227|nr:hypothetical protein [Streptomyces sp. TG1A-8]MDO0925750.1 hypothetical protein [Streptomyces sp. TG1A-8]